MWPEEYLEFKDLEENLSSWSERARGSIVGDKAKKGRKDKMEGFPLENTPLTLSDFPFTQCFQLKGSSFPRTQNAFPNLL